MQEVQLAAAVAFYLESEIGLVFYLFGGRWWVIQYCAGEPIISLYKIIQMILIGCL